MPRLLTILGSLALSASARPIHVAFDSYQPFGIHASLQGATAPLVYEPDQIVFYGDHHLDEDPSNCAALTSARILSKIKGHLDRLRVLAASADSAAIATSYPSVDKVFGSNVGALMHFIDTFDRTLIHLETSDELMHRSQAADVLRHAALSALMSASQAIQANPHVNPVPSQPTRPLRNLHGETLRSLQADMMHFGEHATFLEAAVEVIECIRIESLASGRNSTTEKPPPISQLPDVGYGINDFPTASEHQGQDASTAVPSIDGLLEDPEASKQFHPMGENYEGEDALSDPYFKYQWYLGGPPEQPFGANFLRAWERMLNVPELTGIDRTAFPSSPVSGDFDLGIAIVDMGCGIHDDLVYDASSPFCDQDYSKVGTDQGRETQGGDRIKDVIVDASDLSNEQIQGSKFDDVKTHESAHAQYCQYPADGSVDSVHLVNEGDDDNANSESYFHDASNHGTSTASIIAAGWNDGIGITGLCPFCSVKCIKISVDEQTQTQVNMAGIFRSLEFLATFNHKYPISNHSYGGFFMDAKEVEGHRRLSQVGHMAVVAAGNYGCDIDPLAAAFGAFDEQFTGINSDPIHPEHLDGNVCQYANAPALMPMMPTSALFPTKIQVGSVALKGDLPTFANWGKRTVTLAAPGETIVSLRARNANDVPAGNDDIMIQHGTSFSTPMVAAAAGLIHRQMEVNCVHPTAESIIEVLSSTVSPVRGFEDKIASGGTLNVFEAIKGIPNQCGALQLPQGKAQNHD